MVRALRADMSVRLYVLQSKTQDWTGVDGYHFGCCGFQKTRDDRKKDYFYYVVLLVLQERTFFNLLCRDSLAPSDLTLPGTS